MVVAKGCPSPRVVVVVSCRTTPCNTSDITGLRPCMGIETRAGRRTQLPPPQRAPSSTTHSEPLAMSGASSQDDLVQAVVAALSVAGQPRSTGSAQLPRGFNPTPPDPFSGEDRSKLRPFRRKCMEWLKFFPDVPVSMQASMIGNRLTSLAEKCYLDAVDVHGSDLTPTLLLEALGRDFADPNELLRARKRWRSLRQSSRSVLEYAAEMREIVSAPGMELYANNDAELQAQFRLGLHPAIADRLLLEEFDSLAALVAAADKVEQKLPLRQQGAPQNVPRKPDRSGLRAEVQSSRPAPRPPRPGSAQTNSSSAYQPPHRRVVAGNNGRTLPDRRCDECGAMGHTRPFCPSQRRPADRPGPNAPAR